jgi:hypothetical protein
MLTTLLDSIAHSSNAIVSTRAILLSSESVSATCHLQTHSWLSIRNLFQWAKSFTCLLSLSAICIDEPVWPELHDSALVLECLLCVQRFPRCYSRALPANLTHTLLICDFACADHTWYKRPSFEVAVTAILLRLGNDHIPLLTESF